MNVFIMVVLVGIFLETSFLCVRTSKRERRITGRRKIFVDSSALMDGRIVEVAKTGFLGDEFLIPKSVTREMQVLADGKDGEKRARARTGLDKVNELERVVYINTEIFDDTRLGKMPVDERLLVLAKEEGGLILTCDYNLAKVAATEKIETLNINELATVLNQKMQAGDRFRVRVIEKGSNPKQGVGHLEDGTMVVIQDGERQIGKEIEVEFARYLQTEAGRIIFAVIPKKKKNFQRG